MKITCHSCQAKYTIADEKVAGKTVKIKCKKCSATIVVHGDPQQQGAQTLDPNLVLGAQAGEEDVETRVFNGETGAAPGEGGDEWTVNVTDDDQRTMTTAQIVIEWQRGALNADTYVWKDGMGDWLPITGVPELMQLVGGGPAAVAPEPQFGLGGTMMMEAGAAASASRSPAAPAAKRAGGRAGAVDLFGAQPEPAASQAPLPAGDRLVGERNENSVLFSLSALTATENAARAQSPSPGYGGGSRAPAAPRPGQNGGRAGLDDIMNMSGGLSAAPMLAPPPLLAPVIEAPPPPPVMMQQPMMNAGQAAYGMPMSQPMPQPKSKAGLIIGIVLGVVVLGGIGAFLATRSSTPEATATNDQASATGAATAAPPAQQSAAPTAAPTAQASSTAAAAADTGAPSSAPSADAKTADNKDTGHGHAGGPMPGHDSKKEEKVADKKEEKAPEKAPDKPEKKEEPAAGGGGEFNRGAATSALGAAAGAARGCAKPDGPTGSGRVKVTFAPSGRVTTATIEGPPFAGTAVGGCIAGAFRGAHIPPFDGSPVSVTKSFSVN